MLYDFFFRGLDLHLHRSRIAEAVQIFPVDAAADFVVVFFEEERVHRPDIEAKACDLIAQPCQAVRLGDSVDLGISEKIFNNVPIRILPEGFQIQFAV
jgi:hypothetical protein